MRFAAIVLAAGKSTRMGVNKLLLKVAGRTILDRLLDALEASVVGEIVVVLGHDPESIRPVAEAHRVRTVMNPDYERGMTSSFQVGLRWVSADAAFLVLGDQLGLDQGLLDRMAGVMESDPSALIVSPVHEEKRGHPVLFRKQLFGEIMGLGERETVRDVVTRHEDAHRTVEGGPWSVLDIDTPEDFERAVRLFGSGPA